MTHACCDGSFWLYIFIVVFLVSFSGLMSGLTLGLMSLGILDLEVLEKSGTEKDKTYAARILPVVKNQHLLLCTLLTGNALAMEALPIFLDALVPSYGAILISVTLILLFGEIIPQALCTRYGLAIGSRMAPFVRVLVVIFLPVSYPISKLLDYLLGKKHQALFRRAELQAYVTMHGKTEGKGGDLTHDETTIIAGALEMTGKTVEEAMTPISSIFALNINTKLDWDTMNEIMSRGHSRVPVYVGLPTNIIGLVLVKNLLTVRPEDAVLVRNVTVRTIPRVDAKMPLYDLMNEFQKGHSHMAAVIRSRCIQESPGAPLSSEEGHTKSPSRKASVGDNLSSKPENVVALAHTSPVAEAQFSDSRTQGAVSGTSTAVQGRSQSFSDARAMPDLQYDLEKGHVIRIKGSPPTSTGVMPPIGISRLARSQSEGGREPSSSSRTGGGRRRKWKHTGEEAIIQLGAEETPVGEAPPGDDTEVVGIITMEDVIEELLQEEILDETDEYINVHNKIKVASALRSVPPLRLPRSDTSDL